MAQREHSLSSIADHRFEVFADYFQFYLVDDDARYGDLSDAWPDAAVGRMLALGPHVIGIGTARNMTVPVMVRVCEGEPDIGDAGFDRVNACTMEIGTGRIVIAGCTDYLPNAARIEVQPGIHDALIGYKGLDTVSEDGLAGDDSYHIFLWRR